MVSSVEFNVAKVRTTLSWQTFCVKARQATRLILSLLLCSTMAAGLALGQEDSAAKTGVYKGEAPLDLAQVKKFQAHIQKLVSSKLLPATVNVQVGAAQGSGVIISEDGYVLTAAHVGSKPNRDVTFVFPDGRRVSGKTLGLNRTIDAGLMKITQGGKYPFVEMGDSKLVKPGDWCLSTGHPGGLEPGRPPVLRVGRVLSSDENVIVSDCTLIGGDSGGPLFDIDGKVIGINSRIGSSLDSNMHVPVLTYKDTWDRLAKGEAWGHLPGANPYIGVQGSEDSDVARVGVVFPGTPADKAGLEAGDIIEKFDGKVVADFPALVEFVKEHQPGDSVDLVVKRGEETMKLKMVIGKRSGPS
ncbi:MAG: serine protease Do [Pirellulaceae bacterium]|jgi:serine protease Do